jgi:uroporphyrin-3 C-methyltransferase
MSDTKTPIPAKKAPSSKPVKTANTASNKPVYILVFLFTLLLIVAVGFFQYRLEALVSFNSVLEHQISALDQQARNQLESTIAQKLELKRIAGMDSQLAAMQQTLNQIPGARMNDWKLAEVEYLLRLGNQRVTLQQELTGARALFDAANTILAALDDPGLLNVREKIAEEMLALGQEGQLDRQGIYTQIQALKAQVHEQIQPPITFKPLKVEPVLAESATIWQQLTSLVHIRYAQDAFEAPLDAQQYQILEHSLLLMLEQSQWALLKADQSLYQSSLENAIGWINSKLRHKEAIGLSEQLSQLKGVDIQLHIPDVSGSLALLRQTLSDRTYQPSLPNVTSNNKGRSL